VLFVNAAYASDYNKNYSLFTLGYESVAYKEDTGAGISATSPNTGNIIQYSKGYTALNEDFGFYITTASPLVANTTTESWDVNGFGLVQQNRRNVRVNDLSIDLALNQGADLQILAGLGWKALAFSRSAFSYPKGTQGNYNAATQIFTPVANGSVQEIVSAAGTKQYITRQPGAIYENASSASLRLGVNYDSFFSGSSQDWRWIGGVMASVPIYYGVENSNFPNTSWTSYFKGYDIEVNAGVGIPLTEKLQLLFLASGSHAYRPRTSIDVATSGFVPNTTIDVFRSSMGLIWSY